MDKVSQLQTEQERIGAKNDEQIPAICGICPEGCWVKVNVDDGKLTKVSSHQGNPLGLTCMRGLASPEIVYSADRISHPLKREGQRGERSYQKITWDEALDGIVDKMQEIKEKYGPQAIMSYSGRGAFEPSFVDMNSVKPLLRGSTSFLYPFGSPNTSGVGSVCYYSYGFLAPLPTFGIPASRMKADLENTEFLLLWGANPSTDSPLWLLPKVKEAIKRGAKVIAIDPIRTATAKLCGNWLPIRPGTDGALALAMINVIIQEKLYDEEVVTNWTVGFAELKEYVSNFTPEAAEKITDVPQAQIVAIAREIACKRSSYLMYTGLEYTNSGVQNIRAVMILFAITGNLDTPGGILLNEQPRLALEKPEIKVSNGVKPVGANKYPLFYEYTDSAHFMEARQAILEDDPYPIKGLIVIGSSLITSYPNVELTKKALSKLELLVIVNRFETADTAYADYFLPSTTYYENLSYMRYPNNYVRIRERVIEPLGEAKNDSLIISALANRLGYGHLFPQDEQQILDWAFAKDPELLKQLRNNPLGVQLPINRRYRKYEQGLLRSDGKPGFNTPSGKIEIASSILQEYGYDALPVYTEPLEGPLKVSSEMLSKFPLIMTSGARINSAFRSQFQNITKLVNKQKEAQILIHVDDAAQRGISDGDKVKIRSPRGEVVFTAKVTNDIKRGVVEVNAGGGSPIQAEGWREANPNYLTDEKNRDPISGFPAFKALQCEVEKIES
ncbi:MAG: molybdopterin-dependent oxidoreductase [Thermincola sp.]|jgi:anaerobic selenocysteine-containing dehydrogenase|nr:molybdopterin-dependent oxidoreductase [Thermincola sp.]MDT3703025.1 molybdopterin-dependent oxidoreductase [Thermincola sp.]